MSIYTNYTRPINRQRERPPTAVMRHPSQTIRSSLIYRWVSRINITVVPGNCYSLSNGFYPLITAHIPSLWLSTIHTVLALTQTTARTKITIALSMSFTMLFVCISMYHFSRPILYTPCPKKCDYIFYNNFNNKCPITIIFGIVSSKSTCHRKVVSFPTSPI